MANYLQSNEKCIPSWLLQSKIKSQIKKKILNTARYWNLNRQTNDQLNGCSTCRHYRTALTVLILYRLWRYCRRYHTNPLSYRTAVFYIVYHSHSREKTTEYRGTIPIAVAVQKSNNSKTADKTSHSIPYRISNTWHCRHLLTDF